MAMESPVFRPTEEQWQDPLSYISSVVRPACEAQFGICKIVPPAGWAPPFAIDKRRLKFPTRLQAVHQLQSRDTSAAVKQFWQGYNEALRASGSKHKKNPTFAGQEIDLYRLHRLVTKRGGYHVVTEEKSWRDIASSLQLQDKSGNIGYTLRLHYQRLLLPYEDFVQAKTGGGAGLLAAALEAEHSDSKPESPEQLVDGIGDDEAAEILEAMLGLAPALEASQPARKRRRSATKDAAANPQGAIKVPENIFTMVCEKCKGGHSEEKIILCDRCDKGWHMFCLSPPLDDVPDGDWICPSCVASDLEGQGFREGDTYSLEDFERIACTFEREWFGSEAKARQADNAEREAEFWRVVEDGEDEAEALYGAELDSSKVGSGFPRAPPLGASSDPYALAPWNLNNLPRASGDHASLLHLLEGDVPGLTIPWVHVGMLFSSSCWHVEEHQLYSINYHHWGADKRWYGVPAHAAGLFESAYQAAAPGQMAAQPDRLFRLATLLSPRTLAAHGVPVHALTQEAGSFVVTFPNAYNAEVNLGVNCSEAVKFAPADWLRFGALSLSRHRHFRKPCAISHDRLLATIAQRCVAAAAAGSVQAQRSGGGEASGVAEAAAAEGGAPSGRTCYWVARELRRVIDEERVLRGKLWSEGLRRSRRIEAPVGMRAGDKHDSACAVCHLFLHLSAVECDCCKRRRTCLHHAAALCECPMRRRRLAWRHTLQELEALHAATAARVPPALAAHIEAEEALLADAERAALLKTTAARVAGVRPAAVDVDAVKTEEEGTAAVKVEAGVGLPAAPAKAEAPEPAAAAGAAKMEEADDLEALAGFMTLLAAEAEAGESRGEGSSRKRRLPSAGEGAAPVLAASLLSANGYVQGPVRPFAPLDVYPEDREAAEEWLAAIAAGFPAWQERAAAALDEGGALAADLQALLEDGEQYSWGGVGAEQAAAAAAIEPRLRAAAEYTAAVSAALRGNPKPALRDVEELLSRHPLPLNNPPGVDKLGEAVDAAREWLCRYGGLVPADPGAAPVEAKALEAAVNEASRLPVTLPEGRALRERLLTARKVAEAIRTALPTSRETGRRRKDEAAVTVGLLRQLRVQAAATKVEMPEVSNLAAALERIDGWQGRVRALDGVRPPLAEVRELLEEAEALPAAMGEAEELKALADKGEAWLRQAAALVRTRAPLKKMRDLLHSGLRLPVEADEVEQLRQDIRRREWEEAARRAGNSKGTLHAVLEVLALAAEMGADDTDLARGLRAKAAAAEAWDMEVAAFLEQRVTGEGAAAAGERPSKEEIAELVARGQATGVKMDRLTFLSNQLAAAGKWVARARECLPPAAAEAATAGEAGANGHAAHDSAAAEEQEAETAAAADVPATQAMDLDEPLPEAGAGGLVGAALPAAPASPAPLADQEQQQPAAAPVPHLDVVTALLKEYDDSLIFFAPEAEGLRKLRRAADAWLVGAQPVLEQESVTDEQLPLLSSLIAGGKACGVAMEEVDILEANVEALLWGQAVRALLARLPELPTEHEAPRGGAAAEEVPPAEQDGRPALPAGLPPPDPEPSGREDPRPLPTTPYDQRPKLGALVALMEEGSILPCDAGLFEKFKRCVDYAQGWDQQARAVLAVPKDAPPQQGPRAKEGAPAQQLIAVQDLRRLISMGERTGMQIPSLQRLCEVLRGHEKWEQRVRDLMASAGARPPFAELRVFQQTARGSPVASNLRSHIDSTVEAIQEWMDRCRRLVAKRNMAARLDGCFEVLSLSVDCGVEQFERRLEVEKRLVATGGRRPGVPGGEGPEDEKELYCLCQQPYHVDTTMISCDACTEWYHMRCVGVTQAQARSLKKYICPICAAVRNNLEPLEAAQVKLRRTRRPDRASLGALLSEVKALPVVVEEEAQLERLLTKWDRWATATNRAVEVHEASRKKDSGGAILPLSDGMLHQLCKSALAMEMDGTEHADRILHLLRCNRWRTRVESALGGSASGAKATSEVVAKLLLEAERLEMDVQRDLAGAKLVEAGSTTQAWQDAARSAIAALKACGSDKEAFEAGVERAKALMKEAEGLPLRVDKDLDALAEYSKPYCICRRPYDDQLPMLECDHCSEWFHFECVGLKGPAEDGSGGGDELPENFRCPTCCMKSGVKYPYFHRLPQASMDALKEAAAAMPAPAPTPVPPPAASLPPGVPPAAAAAMAAMYPQGWQFAAGMRPGMPMPMMHPGMMTPQAMQGMQSMMEAFPQLAQAHLQGLAMAGMMHPGMFAVMHPGLVAAQQQQQGAAAAAAGKEERPAKRQKQEDATVEEQRQEQNVAGAGGGSNELGAALTPAAAADGQRAI